jgi:hypothetical protein
MQISSNDNIVNALNTKNTSTGGQLTQDNIFTLMMLERLFSIRKHAIASFKNFVYYQIFLVLLS